MRKILVLLIFGIIIISGCVSNGDVTELLKQSQQGKEFLSAYPNADITAVRLSNETIASMINEIREDCDPSIPIKSYWKIKFSDSDTNTELISWIDAETQEPICIKSSRIEGNEKQEVKESVINGADMPEPEEENTLSCPSSCDDGNKCTFDYCNELTDYECKYKTLGPCYNNGICEQSSESSHLVSSPNCGMGSSSSGSSSSSCFEGTPAESGYCQYVNQVNSGDNNDCPKTCDDENTETEDYYDFDAQECKHYNCVQNLCPSSCDDNNACTNDYCSETTNYECINEPETPCCGNNQCDAGETWSSCPQDCENPCGNGACEMGESIDTCPTDCKGLEDDLRNLGYVVTYIERNTGQYWNGGSIWNYIMTVIQEDDLILEEGNINLNWGFELSQVVDPLATIYYPDAEISVTLLYTTCGGRYITCTNTISGDSNMGGCSENFNLPENFC